MNIQGIHCQVIGVQIEFLVKLFQGELCALGIINNTVGIHVVGFLDETQKMLLVHAGCSMDVCVHLRSQRGSYPASSWDAQVASSQRGHLG